MKDFPKYINTKADVEYLLNHYPDEMKCKLKEWLAERFKWMTVKKLSDADLGLTDETHRIAEIKDETTEEIKERYQEEWKADPNCTLFRLGITVEDAEGMIA